MEAERRVLAAPHRRVDAAHCAARITSCLLGICEGVARAAGAQWHRPRQSLNGDSQSIWADYTIGSPGRPKLHQSITRLHLAGSCCGSTSRMCLCVCADCTAAAAPVAPDVPLIQDRDRISCSSTYLDPLFFFFFFAARSASQRGSVLIIHFKCRQISGMQTTVVPHTPTPLCSLGSSYLLNTTAF